jgi:hypothetical protein
MAIMAASPTHDDDASVHVHQGGARTMNGERPLTGQLMLWSASLDLADHAALDPGEPHDLDWHPDVGMATNLGTRS